MPGLLIDAMQRFNYLAHEIDAAYHDAAQKMGFSDSAMMILYAVCTNGTECPLQEITDRSGVSKQTINSALRKLEAEGIVTLAGLGQAGRKKKVCLTDDGKAAVQNTLLRMIQIENEILGAWSAQEQAQYLDLTQRYLTAFRTRTEEEL